MNLVRFRCRTWLCLILSSLFAIAFCGTSKAAIYWTDWHGLGVVNLDGSYPTHFWSGFPSPPIGQGCGVAIDAQYIYWADYSQGRIGRAGLDATRYEPAFIEGVDKPCGVAVDGQHVYWASSGEHTIGRASIDGSNPDLNFVVGLDKPCGVAVDGSHVYWADNDDSSIGRANIDGSQPKPLFIEGIEGACGVAVDETHIFWGTFYESIGRANLDGSMVDSEFIGDLERPCGVASDGSRLFWTEQGSGGSPGRLGVASVDGSAVNRDFLTDLYLPCGVAVDSSIIVPSPPKVANFGFGRVRHAYRTGQAVIRVDFPAGGTAKVHESRQVKARFLPERTASIELAAAGVKWIKLSVNRKTAAGRCFLRRLRRSGRQPVSFGLEYAEEGERAVWRTKRLSLLMRPLAR